MPHGIGKHTDIYGNVIEGEFKNGFVNGYATKTFTSGKIARGTWENSLLIDEEIFEEIFDVVEQNPEFKGGMAKLYEFLGRNIQYPE